MDYYKILGVQRGATDEEIKAAYKVLAQKYNPDNFEEGAARDEAVAKTNELNEAFDALMSSIRTGQAAATMSGNEQNQFAELRRMINSGDTETALSRLLAMPNCNDNAEWNFLVGSAYYYKGWLGDAMRYFEAAHRIDPNNREYESALNNMQNNSSGRVYGNPYGNRQYQNSGMGCSCCDMCTAMMCMDMCCGCGNGC